LTRQGKVPEFLIFWIENLLISYPVGGKQGDGGRRGRAGLEKGRAGRSPCGDQEGVPGMRVMFWTWIVLITTGLVFYSIIGLAHN
jgi:hypothetical protein